MQQFSVMPAPVFRAVIGCLREELYLLRLSAPHHMHVAPVRRGNIDIIVGGMDMESSQGQPYGLAELVMEKSIPLFRGM